MSRTCEGCKYADIIYSDEPCCSCGYLDKWEPTPPPGVYVECPRCHKQVLRDSAHTCATPSGEAKLVDVFVDDCKVMEQAERIRELEVELERKTGVICVLNLANEENQGKIESQATKVKAYREALEILASVSAISVNGVISGEESFARQGIASAVLEGFKA